jgi:hypothetical protein
MVFPRSKWKLAAKAGGQSLTRGSTATELPQRLLSHVNARFVGRVTSLLAANRRIEEDIFLVDFPFDGQTVRTQATFVDGDEILIGTRLLRDYRLQIDFPAGTVAIKTT